MTIWLSKFYVRIRESKSGQTMTEYALILAAVAVAALIAYQGLGTSVGTLANNVAGDL
ncbi:MAG TPA: Flp family type IVb pilin [Candidatus Binataceae bacterium]|nr:Flp family type IVb pilin [Candidatus Binataceae bacterium]